MRDAGESDPYAITAEMYDPVVPYRERTNVAFFVQAAQEAGGPVLEELIYSVTYPDDRQVRLVDAFPMRYLFRFEAEHLLVRSGFAVEALYADYERNPYGSKYPGELIFVARKVDG